MIFAFLSLAGIRVLHVQAELRRVLLQLIYMLLLTHPELLAVVAGIRLDQPDAKVRPAVLGCHKAAARWRNLNRCLARLLGLLEVVPASHRTALGGGRVAAAATVACRRHVTGGQLTPAQMHARIATMAICPVSAFAKRWPLPSGCPPPTYVHLVDLA